MLSQDQINIIADSLCNDEYSSDEEMASNLLENGIPAVYVKQTIDLRPQFFLSVRITVALEGESLVIVSI